MDELLNGPGVEKSLLAAKIQRLHILNELMFSIHKVEDLVVLDQQLPNAQRTKPVVRLIRIPTPAFVPS